MSEPWTETITVDRRYFETLQESYIAEQRHRDAASPATGEGLDPQNEARNTPHRDSWVQGFRQGMIVAGVRPPWTVGETEAEYRRWWPTNDDPFVAPEVR